MWGIDLPDKELETVMAGIDENKDWGITIDEWIKFMTGNLSLKDCLSEAADDARTKAA